MGGSLAAAALFLAVGTAIALIRLRTSPLYPAFNDVNSDIYVFAMVGNSWTYGLLPYRDVYDVKGPFLYLLFGLFAKIQPWSMGPPLAFLALLASSSVWLAYAIARLHRLGRPLAVAARLLVELVLLLRPPAAVSASRSSADSRRSPSIVC